jgi:hypothetical protein
VLELHISFEALPLLPDQFHLVATDKTGKSMVPIPLPPLVARLTPGPVRFTAEGKGYYHLEGDHLKAVDRIRIESGGKAILVKATVGYNTVDFFINPKQLTDKATYSVFAVISGLTVPLYQENAKKQLEQVSFTYEKPKEDKPNTGTPAGNGDSQEGKETTNVKLKMDIDLKTDAEAKASKTRKPSGTASPAAKKKMASPAGGQQTGAANSTNPAAQQPQQQQPSGAAQKKQEQPATSAPETKKAPSTEKK